MPKAMPAIPDTASPRITDEIGKALVLAAITFIEKDTSYDKLSSRLFQQNLYKEVIGDRGTNSLATEDHRAFLYDKEKIINKD